MEEKVHQVVCSGRHNRTCNFLAFVSIRTSALPKFSQQPPNRRLCSFKAPSTRPLAHDTSPHGPIAKHGFLFCRQLSFFGFFQLFDDFKLDLSVTSGSHNRGLWRADPYPASGLHRASSHSGDNNTSYRDQQHDLALKIRHSC